MKPSRPSPGLHSCQSPALTGSWWGFGLLTASWTYYLTGHCTGSHLRDHNINTDKRRFQDPWWLSYHFILVLRTHLTAKILTRFHVEGTGGTAITALGWERAVVHYAFISCWFYSTNRITVTIVNAESNFEMFIFLKISSIKLYKC